MAGRIPPSARAGTRQHIGSRMPQRAPERPRVEHNIQRMTQAETNNKFYVDLENVPIEYECEWKRMTILGAEDTRNQAISRRNGWEPAPRGNHPEIMGLNPSDDAGKPIIIDGLMLCYRPWDVSQQAHDERIADTAYHTQQMLDSLRGESTAQVGSVHTRFSRQAEPAPPGS